MQICLETLDVLVFCIDELVCECFDLRIRILITV